MPDVFAKLEAEAIPLFRYGFIWFGGLNGFGGFNGFGGLRVLLSGSSGRNKG